MIFLASANELGQNASGGNLRSASFPNSDDGFYFTWQIRLMEYALTFISGFAVATTFVGFYFLRQQNLLKGQLSAKDTEFQLLKMQTDQTQKSSDLMAEKFELLASRIFEDKSHRFQDQSLKNLTLLLEPFKERLKDFEKKVEDSYSQERTERGSLRGELQQLMQLNLKMSSEAESLTKALRGDNRAQGAWGEMILESILEKSGLRKDSEYYVQGIESSLKNEDGAPIRPDVIINLPEGKHLIVDSKVSLTAYDQYVNSDANVDKEKFAKLHSESLKRHVDLLAAKKYHTADKLISPDFVVLFMPLESAFAVALKFRPDLQQEAWDKRVAIVSPTTLLVTLKMVSALWKTERQERNAQEIAEKGGLLYDKFVGLITDLEMMGKKFDDAKNSYDGVMSKLKDGRGNLLRQVDQLRELGVKSSKRLSLESIKDSLP